MSNTISATEIQKHFEEILNRVYQQQEELIIEQAGKKIARLSPISEDDKITKLDFRDATGLGADIWKKLDVENYLKTERQTWD